MNIVGTTWQRREPIGETLVQLARSLGRLPDECYGAGWLLMANMGAGWTRADHDTLRGLIERAERAKLASVSSYLITLRAYDAFGRGQYFTARTSFEDAVEICRRFGEPTAALTTIVTLSRMYATLECWQQVSSLLERGHGLLAEAVGDRDLTARERLTRVQLQNLGACQLAADRHPDEAHAAFSRTFAAARDLPFAQANYVGWQWFEAMVDQDRPDLAAAVIAAVEPYAVDAALPDLQWRLPFWRAWLQWRAGDLASAAISSKSSGNSCPTDRRWRRISDSSSLPSRRVWRAPAARQPRPPRCYRGGVSCRPVCRARSRDPRRTSTSIVISIYVAPRTT